MMAHLGMACSTGAMARSIGARCAGGAQHVLPHFRGFQRGDSPLAYADITKLCLVG